VPCAASARRSISAGAVDQALVKVLLRALLDHATAASPNGGSVGIRLSKSEESLELCVRDDGPAVPEASRLDLLSHRVDPSRLGRPIGIALLVARSAAGALSGELVLGESPEGGQELLVRFR
jgi:K+-sensing histidine kinase KdpD